MIHLRRHLVTCAKESIRTLYLSKSRTMCTFVSTISPITGKMEWVAKAENYDFHQEVARSAYADMLHDTERNEKYYVALKRAITLQHQRGRAAVVLDIGTGTGLLSMMAASSGADMVFACEAFKPMAECARRIMKQNGLADKIKLVPKRSTEITVGPGGDLEQRANILVTEVFDTELIGEGAIGTFHHAHEHLLEDDCIVVPSAANMYIQPVSSHLVRGLNKFQPIEVGESEDIMPPADVVRCPGAPAVHDIQLDQLPQEQFTSLAEPLKIFRFDYSGKSRIHFHEDQHHKMAAAASGSVDAIFMWWDLEMDTEREVLLSCAPRWGHPEPENMQWRDHWMQAVYYPATSVSVNTGDTFTIHSSHDDYSLWFDVSPGNDNHIAPKMPACECGGHIACSRTRIGMLSDPRRNKKYISALKKVITEDSICLCRSDGSLLPVLAARLGAKHVYCVEVHPMMRRLLERYIAANNLQSSITILAKQPEDVTIEDLKGKKADILLGEPYFSTSTLPWHHIHYWYAKTELSRSLADDTVIIPRVATLWGIAVDFKDLWKIRAPVGNCEGFDLSIFDNLVLGASHIVDENVEPQPLWEYPGVPMTEPFRLLNFDFTQPLGAIRTFERKGALELWSSGKCSGVAMWMEFHLDGNNSISTGLQAPAEPGETLEWDMYTRQGVHLFRTPVNVDSLEQGQKSWKLRYRAFFKPKTGAFEFDFKLVR